MAKASMIARERKREKTVIRYSKKRAELKEMIKNPIILLLIYIIGVLLFASSSNVDLLKQKAVEVKEFIWKGKTWFKTQEEESYPKEKNKVAPWDAPTPLPSPRSFLLPEEILDEPLSEKPKKE